MAPVGFPQHRSASGGQHLGRSLAQAVQHLFLDIAKARLTLALKKLANRAADPNLNLMVRIDKRQLKPPGELPPDGGLPGAGKADQTDGHKVCVKNVATPLGEVMVMPITSFAEQPDVVTVCEVFIVKVGSVPGDILGTLEG